MPPRYEGIVSSIIDDKKNKKTLLILRDVPEGAPCRVDIEDCIPIERGRVD